VYLRYSNLPGSVSEAIFFAARRAARGEIAGGQLLEAGCRPRSVAPSSHASRRTERTDGAVTQDRRRPRLVGINHVAPEVGHVEEAPAFHGRIFDFTSRAKGENQAFIDMGDQLIALLRVPTSHQDGEHLFGLVVDDRSAVRERAARAGAILLDGPFPDFLDPWGDRVRVVAYADLQFTKAPEVLRAMGLSLEKSEQARRELAGRGMLADKR
jgi:hypothetical protein